MIHQEGNFFLLQHILVLLHRFISILLHDSFVSVDGQSIRLIQPISGTHLEFSKG